MLTTLYSFCPEGSPCIDGDKPFAGLLQATNGNLYGTTFEGGAYSGPCPGIGCGTIFKISLEGMLVTLDSFCSPPNCTNGADPYAGLIESANGNLYGTASYGGAYYSGTIFSVTPSGILTTLYSFCPEVPACTDGFQPEAGLVQAANGNFYGTTSAGGASGACTYTDGCGTVFKITPSGKLTTLYNFCAQKSAQGACADGYLSNGLVQAADGNFYGTTVEGGVEECYYTNDGCGTVFKITPAGKLTTLYSFCTQKTVTGTALMAPSLAQD